MNGSDLWKMLAIVLILVVFFVVFVVGEIPEGYEDDSGFHYGKKDK